jgi:hypothetical protein
MDLRDRLLRSAIAAAAAVAAGLLTRSMVKAVSAPDDGTIGSLPPGHGPDRATGMVRVPEGTTPRVEDDWRSLLDGLPLGQRLKALAVYELARDRAMGQPPETVAATLRAAATAEGLDAGHDWIPAAAAHISADTGP